MFNLSRYFLVLSFILVVLAAGALGWLYRAITLHQLTDLATARNVAMAQVFRNSLWPRYGESLLKSAVAGGVAGEASRKEWGESVTALMHDTDVVRVKIFNPEGITVFSTEASQIGEDKRNNPGFKSALSGTVSSELTHRNTFDAFEGGLADVDLLSTYLPLRGDHGETQAVLEVYQDVTPFLAYVERTLWWVSSGVFAILAGLYLMQFLVVRRAQIILRSQAAQINSINARLEAQVEERTAELLTANRKLRDEIGERRQAEDRLNHYSYHDALTNLPNRRFYMERLEYGIHLARARNEQLAVLFIDLDQFKEVNDSQGHHVGDELLVAVSRRLVGHRDQPVFLARLGGDEFISLMEGLATREQAAQQAEALLEALAVPFTIQGQQIYVSGSVGVSLFPEDGSDGQTLMRNADAAMYEAKKHGRGRYHFYTPEMTTYTVERIRLQGLLRQAIGQELTVAFQPQVDARSRQLAGAEALVRWFSPQLGQVPPIRLVGEAEECGLIIPLGNWVLRETCRQVVAWDRAGFHLPRVSVNLSVRQLERPDFLETLMGILAETGMSPERLQLEITESVVMAVDDAFALLGQLRQRGIRLSIDDFGTGYSSLNYLKLLPIQEVKVDRSFVIGIGQDRGDEAIIRTVMALAASLGLEVVAEGVEEARQASFLEGVGCHLLQGYLHGRPQDAEAFLTAWTVTA